MMRMVIDLDGVGDVVLEAVKRVVERSGRKIAVLFAAHGSPEAIEFMRGVDLEHGWNDVLAEVCAEVWRIRLNTEDR